MTELEKVIKEIIELCQSDAEEAERAKPELVTLRLPNYYVHRIIQHIKDNYILTEKK